MPGSRGKADGCRNAPCGLDDRIATRKRARRGQKARSQQGPFHAGKATWVRALPAARASSGGAFAGEVRGHHHFR